MIDRRQFVRVTLAAAGLATAGLVAVPARAHGPTPQKIAETIHIAAPPDAVWKLVGDFGAIALWHPGVSACRVSNGNVPGSERDIELDKGELRESLDEYDAKALLIAWRLAKENVEIFPVSFYSASLQIRPAEGGSEVEWTARFYRGDTGNFPSETQDDQAAIAAMTNFYRTGLDGLKAAAEGRK
jgi:mxaD protein